MPQPFHPTFDHEATLEELASVGKNRRFDGIFYGGENEDNTTR